MIVAMAHMLALSRDIRSAMTAGIGPALLRLVRILGQAARYSRTRETRLACFSRLAFVLWPAEGGV